jgi:hypothetical protein
MEYQSIIDRITETKNKISIKSISEAYKAISKDDILANTFREGDIVYDSRTGQKLQVLTTASKRIVKV